MKFFAPHPQRCGIEKLLADLHPLDDAEDQPVLADLLDRVNLALQRGWRGGDPRRRD